MKIAARLLAATLLVGVGWAGGAQAQGQPQGSYQRSCSNINAGGDTLTATCRRADGREDRSALNGYRRCVGDIGNNNGVLQCNTPAGPLRGQVIGGEPFRGDPRGDPRGEPRGEHRGGPPFGGPPFAEPPRGGPGGDWRERCERLRHEADELRGRLQREFNPYERRRLEDSLRDVQNERDRCR